MPENVKHETNRRWNTRNRTSSGAATKNVPAAMTPHSDPASAPEVKDARPTVSTWFDGEDVAISGHRNSFQCAVTETIANATRPGRASGSSTWKMIAQARRAVDQRRLLVFARDGAEGLAHQEHAEGRGEIGRHDAGQRVVEMQRDQCRQVRHDQDRRHQHQLQQEQVEQRLAAREAQPGEGVAGQADRDALHRKDAAAQQDAC